ncbi:hypothetical protein BH09ACT12_BH09ACT12_17440 [soil metagenome]
MSRSTLGLVSCLALCLSLLGCSDGEGDPEPDPGPTSTAPPTPSETGSPGSTSSTGPTTAAFSCDDVTDAELTDATGVSQRVLGPVFDRPLPSCRTAFDQEGMTIEWSFAADSSTFAVIGQEAQLPGLDRHRITIGDEPAWLLEGRVVDTDTALVVLLLDGVKLTVDANTAGDRDAPVTGAQLRAGAEAVASSYVG